MTTIPDSCQNLHRYLINAKNQYQQYLNHNKQTVSGNNQFASLAIDNPQHFIQLIHRQFQRQQDFCEQILSQSVELFNQSLQQIEFLGKNCHELQQQLSNLFNEKNSLKDEIYQLKQQLIGKGQQLISTYHQNLALKSKIDQLYRAFDLEQAQLQNAYEEKIKRQSMDLEGVVSLKQYNQQIVKELLFLRERKGEIQSDNAMYMKQIGEMQKQISKLKDLLDWEKRKKFELQLKMQIKQEEVHRYEIELEQLSQILRNPFEGYKIGEIEEYFIPGSGQEESHKKQCMETDEHLNDHEKKVNGIRKRNKTLKQEIQGIKFEGISKNHSRIGGLKRIDSVQNLTNTEFMNRTNSAHTYALTLRKKLNLLPQLDPYYCHFILLSQAIKIRENNEKLFNVNIKPYYKELINQKVPMYQWQQWIFNKMNNLSLNEQPEILNSNKNYQISTDENIEKGKKIKLKPVVFIEALEFLHYHKGISV